MRHLVDDGDRHFPMEAPQCVEGVTDGTDVGLGQPVGPQEEAVLCKCRSRDVQPLDFKETVEPDKFLTVQEDILEERVEEERREGRRRLLRGV